MMSFETPESQAQELCVFTENDSRIYHSQTLSILKNLATKKARGTYDSEKAANLFMYLAETGAREYVRQMGSPGQRWHDVFPVAVRKIAAAKWRDEFESEYALGNYDNLKPKKYQAAKPVKKKTSSSNDGADLAQRVASNLSEDEIARICLLGLDPPGKKRGPVFKKAYLHRMQSILHAMRGS